MSISWEKDYASAIGRAKSDGKPLFIDFFSPT